MLCRFLIGMCIVLENSSVEAKFESLLSQSQSKIYKINSVLDLEQFLNNILIKNLVIEMI